MLEDARTALMLTLYRKQWRHSGRALLLNTCLIVLGLVGVLVSLAGFVAVVAADLSWKVEMIFLGSSVAVFGCLTFASAAHRSYLQATYDRDIVNLRVAIVERLRFLVARSEPSSAPSKGTRPAPTISPGRN